MNCGMSTWPVLLLKSYTRARAANDQSVIGREMKFRLVAKTRASASAVSLGSASCGNAELMVNGCSGSLFCQSAYEMAPVSCVRCGHLQKPDPITVCAEFDGQRAMRP